MGSLGQSVVHPNGLAARERCLATQGHRLSPGRWPCYHFGASLKDLGTRGFMFSRIEEPGVMALLRRSFEEEWARGQTVVCESIRLRRAEYGTGLSANGGLNAFFAVPLPLKSGFLRDAA